MIHRFKSTFGPSLIFGYDFPDQIEILFMDIIFLLTFVVTNFKIMSPHVPKFVKTIPNGADRPIGTNAFS